MRLDRCPQRTLLVPAADARDRRVRGRRGRRHHRSRVLLGVRPDRWWGRDRRSPSDRVVGFSEAFGAEGSDTLLGSEADDKLDGREGNDRIDGRGGDDELNGGTAPRGSSDVIVGGAGDDVLIGPPAGRATLDGGDGDDMMWGGRGADVASGGSGDDSIGTSIGRDAIDAGPGDDLIYPVGEPRRVACGRGRDLVEVYEAIRPARSCELIGVNEGLAVTRRVRIRGRHAFVRLFCTPPAKQRRCRGTVRLRFGAGQRSPDVGDGPFSVPLGEGRTTRIPLTPGAVRRYRSRGRLTFSPKVVWRRRTPLLGRFTNQVAWETVARR